MNPRLEIIDNCCNFALLPCMIVLLIGVHSFSLPWLQVGTIMLGIVCVTKCVVWGIETLHGR